MNETDRWDPSVWPRATAGSAPAPGAPLPGRQLLVRLDDAAACGSCSEVNPHPRFTLTLS